MPWEIKRNFGGCRGYAVVKEGTTEIEGCHKTRAAATNQMRALYASEPEASKSVKDVWKGFFNPNFLKG